MAVATGVGRPSERKADDSRKPLYNRPVRQSEAGVFNRIFETLAASRDMSPSCGPRGGGIGLRVIRERLVLLATGVGVEAAGVASLELVLVHRQHFARLGAGGAFFLSQSFRASASHARSSAASPAITRPSHTDHDLAFPLFHVQGLEPRVRREKPFVLHRVLGVLHHVRQQRPRGDIHSPARARAADDAAARGGNRRAIMRVAEETLRRWLRANLRPRFRRSNLWHSDRRTGTWEWRGAVAAVQRITGSGRSRALTVARTEIGRAYSVAGQARMAQAMEELPGLRKQWRRSGKIHSRLTHDLADGQVQPVDEPFRVSGRRIMFPRDPAAPPSETINRRARLLAERDY